MSTKLPRNDLIDLLVGSNLSLSAINAALATEGYEALTDVEATAQGLALPPNVTTDDFIDAVAETEAFNKEAQASTKLPTYPALLDGQPALPAALEVAHRPDGAVIIGKPLVQDSGSNPVCALHVAMAQTTANISQLLQTFDPAAYDTYKAMKVTGTREAKARAYVWAFARLMQLGYIPSDA